MTSSHNVEIVSESFIKPKHITQVQNKPVYLNQWDLTMLSVHYIQKGLLFNKPPFMTQPTTPDNMNFFLEKFKEALSQTLVHFYPLAGRLATIKHDDDENAPSLSVYIDCENSPGMKLVYATSDMTVSDVISPVYVPELPFFDHGMEIISHDGHTVPLLSIQATELVDGIFLGCSVNHMVVDGSSFFHFIKVFAEVFGSEHGGDEVVPISRPPVLDRWFPKGFGPLLKLPFGHHSEYISRYECPPLRERIFHLEGEMIAKIKEKANTESEIEGVISSVQALSAFLWRCTTRARGLANQQVTNCGLGIDNRSRLQPPLSENYFGTAVQTVKATTTAGELLDHGIGWSASLLHQAIANHTDETVREWVDAWVKKPFVYQLDRLYDPNTVMVGSYPRFEMFQAEFGIGKALAVRSGYANRFNGKISLYPGSEGGGSMDLEVCLLPDAMTALELDEEFVGAVRVFDKMPQ